MKSGQKDVPKMDEWVKQELEEGKNENVNSKTSSNQHHYFLFAPNGSLIGNNILFKET